MRPLTFLVVAVFAASAVALPSANNTKKTTVKPTTRPTSTEATFDVSAEEDEDVSSRQNSRCLSSQFQCTRGRVQCIKTTLLCNGRRDCEDGSDESYSICYTQPTTESSYYPLGSQDDKTTKQPTFSCRVGVEFKCKSDGRCVNQQLVCNGYSDCTDGSDEEASLCNTSSGNNSPGRQCTDDQFRCKNGECIALGYRCDGTRHCSDSSDEDWEMCQTFTEEENNRPGQGGNGESGNNWQDKLRPCNVPQQPQHGRWRLHRSLCESGLECSPPPNVRSMDPGSYLVYNCDAGFVLKGNRDVLWGPGGKWIHEPKCEEIRCLDLSSSATEAFCLWNNVAVSCEVPAPIGTTAQLKCRQGFVQEVSYTQSYKNVTCQADGKWSPQPIQCVKKPKKVKLVLEGDMILLD